MHKILLLFILVVGVFAKDDNGIVLYTETMVAKDNYTYSNHEGDVDSDNNTFQNIVKVKYYNYINDDLFINVMVTNRYTDIDSVYAEEVMRYRFVKTDTYIESAYLTYRLYENWFISGGIVPFTNGSYNEISELGTSCGSGIIKVIDTPLEAVFLMYKGSLSGMDTVTRFGYGVYDNKNDLLSDSVEKNVEGTTGVYFTYSVFDGFDTFKFNLFMVDYVKNDIDIGNIDIAAIAYNKYLTNYGVNIYGTLAMNHTKLDLTEIDHGVPQYVRDAFPDAFDFEKSDHEYSYLYSLGIAKDIDSTLVESYNIGIEYTYAQDGWISFVNNNYTDNQNYSYIHGDNIFMWFTTKFTTDIALKLFYGISKHDEALKYGNITRTVPFEDTPRESLKVNERYGMKLIMRF